MLLTQQASLEVPGKFKTPNHSRYTGRVFEEITRASKKRIVVKWQMSELIKLFFCLVSCVLALDPEQFQQEWGGDQGIQAGITPGGALLSPLSRHREKCRLEIRKKCRMEEFVVTTFTVQSFYP